MPGTVWTWAAAREATVSSAASRRLRREIRFNSLAPWNGLTPILPGLLGSLDRVDGPGNRGVEGGAAFFGAGALRIADEPGIDRERGGRVVEAGMLHLAVVSLGNDDAVHLFRHFAQASKVAAMVAQQHDRP